MAQAGAARFASVWFQQGGPAVEARHNLTSDQHQQTVNELFGRGFRPIWVSGYGNEPRFASIWLQEDGPAVEARHNLTSDQHQETVNELFGRGFRPICVSG
ncbi:hypothetical protein, partial [Streptomyces sp. NPDC001135]